MHMQMLGIFHVFSMSLIILYSTPLYHSATIQMHHEFIGFLCNPGSKSSDPGRVMFDHGEKNRSQKIPYKNVKWFSWYLEKSKGMSCFGIRKTAINLNLFSFFFQVMHFFGPRVHGIESQIVFQSELIYLHSSPKDTTFRSAFLLKLSVHSKK